MRLNALSLRPFAGFRKLDLSFGPGMNVLLGRNDVGKSSVFRAIESALLLPCRPSRASREGRELLPRLIPLGGDHAIVRLEGRSGEQAFTLERRWGAGAEQWLELGEAAAISQEARVEEALSALLPAPPAVLRQVLFMGQGALPDTVNALGSSPEALQTLGDYLRVAMNEAAGVSIDAFKARLEERIQRHFSHWDIPLQRPERGRGIDDPWQKNVGTLLAAFYQLETLRKERREAEEIERELDRRSAACERARLRVEQGRAFLEVGRPWIASGSERRVLEVDCRRLRDECARLAADFQRLSSATALLAQREPDLHRLEQEKQRLERELQESLELAKHRERHNRLLRVRELKREADEARARHAALPSFSAEDARRLRTLAHELEALRSGLRAAKIRFQLNVRRELELSFRKDLEPERKGSLQPGKPLLLNAGGRIEVLSEWFELVVSSGDGRAGELEERASALADQLGQQLARLGAPALEQAERILEEIEAAARELREREQMLARTLAPGETLEALEGSVAGPGPLREQRDPGILASALTLVQRSLEELLQALARARSVVSELEGSWGVGGGQEALMELLVTKRSELRQKEAALTALPGLPPGLGDPESFPARFRSTELEQDSAQSDLQAAAAALADIKARLPDQSAEELERACREAAAAFESEQRRGRSLLRVREALGNVEARSADVFSSFEEEFTRLISALSGSRYAKVEMRNGLPLQFLRRGDGAAVPFSWLSAGTRDSFALCLRLSMARHFLRGRSGFLLLDDPLVNLDPERQRGVAALLRELAAELQLLVFTCHPAHAELFGGSLQELSSTS